MSSSSFTQSLWIILIEGKDTTTVQAWQAVVPLPWTRMIHNDCVNDELVVLTTVSFLASCNNAVEQCRLFHPVFCF